MPTLHAVCTPAPAPLHLSPLSINLKNLQKPCVFRLVTLFHTLCKPGWRFGSDQNAYCSLTIPLIQPIKIISLQLWDWCGRSFDWDISMPISPSFPPKFPIWGANSVPDPSSLCFEHQVQPLGHAVHKPIEHLFWHSFELCEHSLLELIKGFATLGLNSGINP